MSITTITRSLPEITVIEGMKGLPADSISTRNVSLSTSNALANEDPYFAGCRFHALLRRISDRDPLSKDEKAMLPWLNALRAELSAFGVRSLTPEVRLACADGIPGGVCDLVAAGGPESNGVIEVKVTNTLPDRGAHEHLLQLGGYAELFAHVLGSGDVWAALAYVSFREAGVRIFTFRDTALLRSRSRGLLLQKAA